MIKHIFLFFILLPAMLAFAGNSAPLYEADKLFNEGNDLATSDYATAQQKWKKAAALMEETIAADEIANGALFYNLGNIYFRLGDIGNAIYSYKMAQRYIPGDVNLLRNLSIARRSRQDKVELQESTRVMKTIFFWHYDLSLAVREKLFLIAFTLLIACGIARLYAKRTILTGAMLLFAVLTPLIAASIIITEYDWHKHPEGVIVSPQVIGRTGYSNSYEPTFAEPLHAGTEFKLKEIRTEWLEIELADGNTTWIPKQTARLL